MGEKSTFFQQSTENKDRRTLAMYVIGEMKTIVFRKGFFFPFSK
jgi:hypothetical protein